ncbi:MAG: hypothetical protein ACREAU_01325 [Nitrosopumilaceae archaeon]
MGLLFIKPTTKKTKEENPLIEAIVNGVSANEATSWKRKMKKMKALIEKIQPIEDAILELTVKKNPIFDAIQELRMEMTNICIHPKEHLVIQGDVVLCKFCDKRLRVQIKGVK